ncbi:MAG: hypothetical protein R6W93_10170 [Candidatus Limnocylindrales bacterium]
MSDMLRPSSPLPPPDHARHDDALVAQLAAGDPLGEDQQREAQRLLSACATCAQLAADLRTLATAVALEPIPPRRRDFRLDSAQAERLGGNAVSRFLRRLSLPQSPAFGPAAAGLFSVGLVFVVAGYAWPGDAGVSVPREPEDPPAAVELFMASPSLEQGVPPASVEEGVRDEVEAFMDESPADRLLDDLAATEDDVAATGEADRSTAAEGSPNDLAGEAEPRSGAASVELAAPSGPETTAAADVDDATVAAVSGDGAPLDAWLILIGFGLAVVGGLLSVLAWLARRVADPLLR